MGNLRIADSNWSGSNAKRPMFNVNVEGNFTISNTKNKNNLQSSEYRVDVKNGKPTINFGRNPGNPEKELSVRSKNYELFNTLRKADKNDQKGEKLTRSDLDALKNDKALQKKLGITVTYDPKEKVYELNGQDGRKIFFDFE